MTFQWLVDQVCSQHGVSSLRDLGLEVDTVYELRDLYQLEGHLENIIYAIVTGRNIVTLHDLSRNLCEAKGVRAFEDLRLGPILKQRLVKDIFQPAEALMAVPALEVADVFRELNAFRLKKGRVKLEEFNNWLAKQRGVASPRSLCLTMHERAIGTTIRFASKAWREENASRAAVIEELREARRDEWRAALDAKVEAKTSAARLGAQLSDAARVAVVEYGGLGATESFRKVAGKIASAVDAAKNAKKQLSVAAELAACYVVTLGDIDVEATRLAVAEAQGLTDHDVANEVREAARALDAEGTVFDALAAAERATAERLRIPSFEALQRGSFLAFASRNADAVAPLAARFAAAAGGVAAGVPDDGDDDGDGDGGADDGSTAVSALDEACERALSRGLSGLDALAAVEAAVSTAAPRAWAPGGFALWLSGLADRAGVRAVVAGAGGGGPAPTRVAERVAAAADALGGDLDAARLARKLGVADLAALGCGADVAAFVRRCSEAAAARRDVADYVADYVAAPRARGAAPTDRDRLGRALEAAPPLTDLGARLRWRFHGRGDLAEFCAARRVSVVVAEDRVYKLLAEASREGLGAACERGDAAGAAAHVATLVVTSRDAAELLRECLRDGLLKLGAGGGDAVALACEMIAAAPPPLRPPVADALLPALEAARETCPLATERDLLAEAKRAGLADALRDLAVRAEACDGARVYPTLLADYWAAVDPERTPETAAAAAPTPPKRADVGGAAPAEASTPDAPEVTTPEATAPLDAPPRDASAASSEPERAALDDESPAAVLASIRGNFGLETDDARVDVSQSGPFQALDNALKVIARDIYSSDSHFLLELLQNADDNDYAPSAVPTIVFDASPEAVVVRNNESGFLARHVRALCSVGESSKGTGGSGYIGQKGIGFKSVFRVSSRPEVHSNGYAFALDDKHMVVPAPCRGPPSPELKSWLAAAKKKSVPRDGTTLVLPLNDEFRGEAKRAELRERLEKVDPLLLLFLNRVRRIDVVDRGADDETTERSMRRADAPCAESNASVVTLTDAVDRAEAVASTWLVVRREAKVPPLVKRGTATQTVLAAAFEASETPRDGAEQLPVFAFLPIAPANLKFVLHADWILASSRETVREDEPWNQWLREEAAGLYVDALKAVRAGAGAGAGFDVARVLEALPVEREVVGFFRPVAAEIARRVRGVDCCLAADGTWTLPSRALAVPEKLRREAPGLLARAPALLGRSCLDQAFQDRLRPDTRTALGVEALDASHALRLAEALADADDLEAPVFIEWAALLFRAAAPAGGVSAADRDRLRSLAVVPLAGGGRGAPGDASVYFDRGEGAEPLEGFAAVRADLPVVDPAVLAPSPMRNMIVSVLRSAGVEDATPEVVCFEHVLPALEEADAGDDRARLVARWRFARAYFEKLPPQSYKRKRLLEGLQKCAVPVSVRRAGGKHPFEPRDAALPAAADVFLAHEHGGFDVLRELSTTARRLEWRYAALDELATSREQAAGWLDFLRLVGCVEFPKTAPRTLERDAWPDAWAAAARDVFSVGDARVVAHDVHSEALERLLAELARDETPANEAVVQALCAVARYIARCAPSMTKKTATLARPGAREGPGLVPSQVSREPAQSVPSSTATLLAETRWVPGAAGGATRLFRPRELYSPLLGFSELHGPRVPVPTDGVCDADRDSYAALGLRDSFGARDALLLLETWAAEEGPFEATVAHFENLYRLLYRELQRFPRGPDADAIRDFFAGGKCAWVPDYRYEAEADDGKRAVVPGAFYALSDCVWADHSRVIDSCVHRGLSAAAPRVLQRHYGSLQGFFCRRLCRACYGDGLGSRGADACPHCSDDGVSSGRPRALVPTAHDLAGHIAIAAALAELDVPHASARADVEAVLRVVSFAILTGRLSEQNNLKLRPLLCGQKVWPTSCGAFAAAKGDRVLVINDDEGLRETLFADADVAAKIAVVAARAAARVRVDLAMLRVPAGGEAEWLAERLRAMRLAGVPVDATGGDLAGAFEALAGSTLPLLAAVDVRPLSQLVETKIVRGDVQFSSELEHELAALLPRAQRWLRSKHRDLYDAHNAAWASFAAELQPRVCDLLRVVHTILGHTVRVKVPARLSEGDNLLYVARGALDDGDWEPVLRELAERFVGRGDAAMKLADDLALTRTRGDKLFDRRGIDALPPDEPEWRATAIIEAAPGNAPSPSLPPGNASSDDEASDDTEAAAPAPPPLKPRTAKKEKYDDRCFPPRQPATLRPRTYGGSGEGEGRGDIDRGGGSSRTAGAAPRDGPGGGSFLPRPSAKLENYCVCSGEPSGDEMATEFRHYLSTDDADATDDQQRLGQRGEAWAAWWLQPCRRPKVIVDRWGADAHYDVVWNNEGDETGEPYDIALKNARETLFFEVKTTAVNDEHKPMEVSINHLDFARDNPENYFILRVFAARVAENSPDSFLVYGRVNEAITTKAIRLMLRM